MRPTIWTGTYNWERGLWLPHRWDGWGCLTVGEVKLLMNASTHSGPKAQSNWELDAWRILTPVVNRQEAG